MQVLYNEVRGVLKPAQREAGSIDGSRCHVTLLLWQNTKVEPPLILNSVLMVSLPSVILYKHLLNSHRLVVVNPLLIFLDLPLTGNHIIQCIVTCTYRHESWFLLLQ